MSEKPVALDLCSGLGGWAEGLEAEGWDVIRVDIVDMFAETGSPKPANCLLMIQDIMTFHGSQAKRCQLIVASPPCTEFSWMAMPWSRAKQVARTLRGEDEFPSNYRGSRTLEQLTALFDACFRIQREASEAAGRRIPMVVENVRGAQEWVGKAAWHHGSFYLWGDIPALMPIVKKAKLSGRSLNAGQLRDETAKGPKPGTGNQLCAVRLDQIDRPNDGYKTSGMNWSDRTKTGQDFTRIAGNQAIKNNGGSWFNVGSPGQKETNRNPVHEGVKQAGISGVRANGKGDRWFQDGAAQSGSKSKARKAASAAIAKIPFVLAQHIARVYKPEVDGLDSLSGEPANDDRDPRR